MRRHWNVADAFDDELQQLRSLGVTASSAETALRLILTAVTHFRALQGWSDEEAVHRFRRIVGAVWTAIPCPKTWESICCYRFETGGARDVFKPVLFDEIKRGVRVETDLDKVSSHRRQLRREPDQTCPS